MNIFVKICVTRRQFEYTYNKELLEFDEACGENSPRDKTIQNIFMFFYALNVAKIYFNY